MKNIETIEKLKHVYTIKYDAAFSKVALLEKELKDVKDQLEEVIKYFNEYVVFFKHESSQGMSGNQLKNHHHFINQFTPVITQQKKKIENMEGHLLEQKNYLYTCFKNLKAVEHILEKNLSQINYLKNKQETLAEQELFLDMHLRKNFE